MKHSIFEKTIAGQQLVVEIGKLAHQTNGSATITLGQTTVLVTAVMGKEARAEVDYLPLMVDYEERLYAAGKISGSRFIKREGRPSEESVLTGRLVDRAIRPFFNQKMRQDIQVIATVLSMDGVNDPDILALLGASIVLMTSDIPWSGPVAALRVGYIDGALVLNPSYEQRLTASLDIFITFNEEGRIVMMETSAQMVQEQLLQDAVVFATPTIQELLSIQKEIVSVINPIKIELSFPDEDDSQKITEIKEYIKDRLDPLLYGTKDSTKLAFHELKTEIKANFPDFVSIALKIIDSQLGQLFKENLILNEKRPDGRRMDEIRDLSSEVDLLPRTHGSGLFNRGDTQSLSIVTLGSPGEAQLIDDMESETKKRFMHHYNFPPFSVGEVRPMRGPGRREIGHGALAEKALLAVIPEDIVFPYTIRIVTEILGSNGSSSMASVCSSSIAMMSAGIPIKEGVAGIAMGLVEDRQQKVYKILTDIQGPEDHFGEMDFKVAGTRSGVNAIQLDVKGDGMTFDMFKEALQRAKQARLHILESLDTTIAKPRAEISPYAPHITIIQIDPSKIGDVIGSAGKVINRIIDETGVKIDIEDDGKVFIIGQKKESIEAAVEWIRQLTRTAEVGEEYDGYVVKNMNFGSFIELFPGQEGLLHISEIEKSKEYGSSQLKQGQSIHVKVKGIDDQGRVNLALLL